MIHLTRIRTTKAIPTAFRGTKRCQQMLKLLVSDETKREFQSTYWKTAKPQLKRESYLKCAYCEALTAKVAHGDVEHFRPKSVYWWLAYCYDNYLYACQICNQIYKGDSFPLQGTRMPSPLPSDEVDTEAKLAIISQWAPDPLIVSDGLNWADFETLHRQENAGLLNPYLDHPEDLFGWEADAVLKEVRLKPKTDTDQAQYAYECAEKYYGLNREELLYNRWTTYRTLKTFVDVWKSNSLEANLQERVQAEIAYMLSDASEYAGMNRFFVRDIWGLNF